ncbi:uncharacterized protein J7T54_005829 [Emericellopsis cladophorae]|uniref:Uncharacterized protein n=1 Tax=Emericellopsis cladophorae TaxID=2686198 RepID=A0A9P9XVD4_9HYPO|nr:uncharacterized protein J7T54_005829 [Emericellopsis cladophorae]KAI6778313.1 hypothetical protein J7T54_005829 [Emericellopsis cladophorae]
MDELSDALASWKGLGIHRVYCTGIRHFDAFLSATHGPGRDMTQASRHLENVIRLTDASSGGFSKMAGAALGAVSTTSKHTLQGLL